MFSRLRLGTQLLLILTFLLATSAAGLTWYLSEVRTRELSASTKQRLDMEADSLAAKVTLLARNSALGSAKAAVQMDFEFLQGVIAATVKSDRNIVFGYVADASDKIVVHSDDKLVGTTIAGAGHARATTSKADLAKIKVGGEDVLEAIAPIVIGDDVWGTVHFGVSLAPIEREAAQAKDALGAALRGEALFSAQIALVVFFVSMIVTVLAARRLVRPVFAVENTIQAVLAGKKNLRVDVPRIPELFYLATGFNALLDRLRDREQQLRAELQRTEVEALDDELPVLPELASPATAPTSADAPKLESSIRARFLRLMIGLTVLSVVVLGALLLQRLRTDMTASLDQMAEHVRADLADKGQAVTRNAALAAGQAAQGKDFLFLVDLVNSSVIHDSDIVSGSIEDPHGRVLVDSDPKKAGTINTARQQLVDRSGKPLLETSAPIQVGGEVWGTLSFGLSQTRIENMLATLKTTQDARMKETTIATLLGVVAVMLAAGLVAWLASRRIVGPLRRITSGLERIRAGDLSIRFHIHSCREYGTFSMGINELTATTVDREDQIVSHIKRLQRYAKRKSLAAALATEQLAPKRKLVDAAVLIDDTRDSLAWPAREKHLRLTLPPLKAGITLEADPAMLGQILYELLSNAIQFAGDGGAVTIELEPIDRDHRRFVRFRVRDTGAGLTKAQLRSIFEPFDRGGFEAKGLGLSIASKMAALHQGALRAESEGAGKGATFTLELPVSA